LFCSSMILTMAKVSNMGILQQEELPQAYPSKNAS
jgi:hypothetical protein